MISIQRLLLLVCIAFTSRLAAQVHITFLLDSSLTNQSDNCYFAGNINAWQPADSSFVFKNRRLIITAKAGDLLEYKITKGIWDAVESDSNGADVSNRTIKANADTIVLVRIAGWKNNFVKVEKKHTASKNVMVLDSAFSIPQLNRTRAIRIYLPPDYATSNKRYPVLYMNDGQNCFDEYTSGFGEWQVDESLDHFYDSCKKSLIVVAVDHGGTHRLQEYNPYNFERFGKGEGKEYTSFLVTTLKPFIDSSFRTQADKKHTCIAGSSMGAVISMWALINYPEVFGNAGIFSPAFWTVKSIYTDTKKNLLALKDHSVFLYAGGNESKTMVDETRTMYAILKGNRKLKLALYIDQLAQHNEQPGANGFLSICNLLCIKKMCSSAAPGQNKYANVLLLNKKCYAFNSQIGIGENWFCFF